MTIAYHLRKRPVFLTTVFVSYLAFTVPVAWAEDRALWENTPLSAIAAPIEGHCFDCHDDTAEGGLNLQTLAWQPSDAESVERWTKIHDRVASGEMPPKGNDLPGDVRRRLLEALNKAIFDADLAEATAKGRGPLRRLTREEFENNLRSLLELPQLDIRDRLPEERTSEGYSKAAATLDMSRVQLEAYLDAAETALHQAMASGVEPQEQIHYRAEGTDLFPKLIDHAGAESMFFAKDGKMVIISESDLKKIRAAGSHDPDLEMALFRSATWPYYGYPRGFQAKHEGTYRVRFAARAVRQVPDFRLLPAAQPLPMTFRARQPSLADVSGDVRATGGWMDVPPESSVLATLIYLKAGEVFEYSLLGLPVPHPITSHGGPHYYDFPPMPAEGHPGVAFRWLEVDGPLAPESSWPPASHRVLFDNLPIRVSEPQAKLPVEVVSMRPSADARRLFRRFATRAAHGPVSDAAQQAFLNLINEKLNEGAPFAEAMLTGYAAFLASGHVLYLPEPEGQGENAQFAIAARLSHFLWNSPPDPALEMQASRGQLRDSVILREVVERLIADERFERFVQQFTDEWLDLDELPRDLPDVRLYPEYRKDDYLVESMERETRTFFTAMIRDNLPATLLVDSDFVYVNDRLARHYKLPPVVGSEMRRVRLPDGSPYGGLMTQASIMKVTANGTVTSPVLRGAWIMKHLLGDPPPKPPPSVPAIEPDIRGGKNVRDILELHRQSKSCSACHARFDPVGFALENFDIMGAWRDRYRGLEKGHAVTGVDRAGHAYEYRVGQEVQAFGQLRTGESFHDVRDLKKILAANPRQLARNLLHQFTLYSTGTPVRYADREGINAILDQCESSGYRVRDLLHGLIQSKIFCGYASDTN